MSIESYQLQPAITEINQILSVCHKKHQILFDRAFGTGNTAGKTDDDLTEKISQLKASVVGVANALSASAAIADLSLILTEQADKLNQVSSAIDELTTWRSELASITTKYSEILTAIDDAATADPDDAVATLWASAKERLLSSAEALRQRIDTTQTAISTA